MMTQCSSRSVPLGDDEIGMHGKLNVRSLSNFWVTLRPTTIHIFSINLNTFVPISLTQSTYVVFAVLFLSHNPLCSRPRLCANRFYCVSEATHANRRQVAGDTCSLVVMLFWFISVNLPGRRKAHIHCPLHTQQPGLSMCFHHLRGSPVIVLSPPPLFIYLTVDLFYPNPSPILSKIEIH